MADNEEQPNLQVDRRRPFRDRADAGRQLAEMLVAHYRDRDCLVLALPRGGVPVGYEVARALGAPLDVFIVRKLGAPSQPELGIGAVGPGGVLVLDTETIRALKISQAEIDHIVAQETTEMERRVARFRGERPMLDTVGKVLILVDDGLATGVTASAAARALRQTSPSEIVLAVPVCAAATATAFEKLVDRVLCAICPETFGAVGFWYDNFEQTTDDEVVALLERNRQELSTIAVTAAQQSGQHNHGIASAEGVTNGAEGLVEVPVQVQCGDVWLSGDLQVPHYARGVVLFAHGSGSSRHSSRNRYVAGVLNATGFATLLMDLLTDEEELAERETGHLRFDVKLLASRLVAALDWLGHGKATRDLPIGLFGASTGAAAALTAAAERPDSIRAIVSRGGRPDLAGSALPLVRAATLLLVGGEDTAVIALNREAYAKIEAAKELIVIPGATHLFPEPGKLEEVARLASLWFGRHIGQGQPD